MKKINVAFDIDETLIEVMPTVEKLLLSMYDTKLLPVVEYTYKTEKPVSLKELWELFGEMYHMYEDTKPFQGASELLYELFQATGDTVRLVTARPKWASTETHLLLQKFFPVPYELCMVGSKPKINYLDGIDYFVDDRRKTALELADSGKKVYVPMKTYNKGINHKNICYIKDINILRGHIEQLIK